jgi:hypothetical protein
MLSTEGRRKGGGAVSMLHSACYSHIRNSLSFLPSPSTRLPTWCGANPSGPQMPSSFPHDNLYWYLLLSYQHDTDPFTMPSTHLPTWHWSFHSTFNSPTSMILILSQYLPLTYQHDIDPFTIPSTHLSTWYWSFLKKNFSYYSSTKMLLIELDKPYCTVYIPLTYQNDSYPFQK